MLHVQERQIRAPTIGLPMPVRQVPAGDRFYLQRALADVLSERECNQEILRVLDRAASDNGFIAELTYCGAQALERYNLSTQAVAALLSGDLRWTEARLGKLDARLRTWLDCRLEQEIW